MDIIKELGFVGLSVVIGVVGWFLRQKDAAQEKQLSLLWTKHDEDVKALGTLKERVDREYYAKAELDARMNQIRGEVHDGFRKLEEKFDKMTNALLACNKGGNT
jgi:hypothetical protein